MLKKCLKILVVLFACVFAFGMSANATETRDLGLAISEGNSFMIDGTWHNVFVNPASFGKFKNTAYFESDGTDHQGGLIVAFGNLTFSMPMGIKADPTGNVWGTGSALAMNNVTDPGGAFGFTPMATTSSTNLLSATYNLIAQSYTGDTDPAKIDKQDIGFLTSYDAGPLSIGIIFAFATASASHAVDSPLVGPGYGGAYSVVAKDKVSLLNSQYTIKVGAEYRISDSMKVGVDLAYVAYVLKNKYSRTGATAAPLPVSDYNYERAYKGDGAGDMAFGATFSMALSEKSKLHLDIHDKVINHSTKATDEYTNNITPTASTSYVDKYSRKANILEFGISDEINLSKDTLVYSGFLFTNTACKFHFTSENKTANATILYNQHPVRYNSNGFTIEGVVGAESKLSENWTGRFGVTQMIYEAQPANNTDLFKGTKNGDTDAEYANTRITNKMEKGSTTDLAIGLSYTMGNVTVDWLGNVQLLIDGPNFISNATNAWSTMVAATLNFDSLISGKK